MGPCSVAVLKGGQLSAHQLLLEPNQQVKMLMPMAEAAMEESKLTYSELDAVAITIGPGSFTGIRIAMSAAHGLALAGNIPLIGITTLEAIAFAAVQTINHQPSTINNPFIGITMNAGRGMIYGQWFRGSEIIPTSDALMMLPEEFARTSPAPNVLLAGNATALVVPFLPSVEIVDITYPDAKHFGMLAMQKQDSGAHLSPLYIRPPDAKLPGGLSI